MKRLLPLLLLVALLIVLMADVGFAEKQCYGVVYDIWYNSVDGADVYLQGPVNKHTLSDGDGTYAFSGLEIGWYKLWAEKGNQKSAVHDVYFDGETPIEQDLVLGIE